MNRPYPYRCFLAFLAAVALPSVLWASAFFVHIQINASIGDNAFDTAVCTYLVFLAVALWVGPQMGSLGAILFASVVHVFFSWFERSHWTCWTTAGAAAGVVNMLVFGVVQGHIPPLAGQLEPVLIFGAPSGFVGAVAFRRVFLKQPHSNSLVELRGGPHD